MDAVACSERTVESWAWESRCVGEGDFLRLRGGILGIVLDGKLVSEG